MKYEEVLNSVLEISREFSKADKENTPEIYFEILHSYLIEIISGYTEESFHKLTQPFSQTLMKLEKQLLDCCSMTYYKEYQEYIKEKGLFREKKETKPEDKIKIITKCKQPIGYIVEADEGLNI